MKEKVYFDGDYYFADLQKCLAEAKREIIVESYIWEVDTIGSRILAQLIKKRAEGLSISIVLDAIGSFYFSTEIAGKLRELGIEISFYHGLIDFRKTLYNPLSYFSRINKRNHRKFFIIDDTKVFMGGMNIADIHTSAVKENWKDYGLYIEGADTRLLKESHQNIQKELYERVKSNIGKGTQVAPFYLNDSFQRRKNINHFIVRKILNAERRVVIVTPYYNPTFRFNRAFKDVSKRVDVKLITAEKNNHFFPGLLNFIHFKKLGKCGIKICLYKEKFLHAKLLVIDDEFYLGSLNFNLRSLLHDQEIVVEVTDGEAKKELEMDLKYLENHSVQFSYSLYKQIGIIKRTLANIVYLMRYWF
ncbi:MAG: hypothetical protein H6621_02540 [Halobacteriovoraceae bacterium]|nr:hypothetical protein [Halobacteriovoraceae bacterium]MCB9093921.1 hypothetical protein [Halobacteriovoraceae bacterium]